MRLLRRLLVVGLAGAVLALPAVARAGTVAIFYYPWYGTPAVDGGWQHWRPERPPAAGRPLLALLPGARARTRSSDPAVVDAADGADRARRASTRSSSRGGGAARTEDARLPLVIADGAPAGSARRHPPRAVRRAARPRAVAHDLAYIASLGVRDVYVYHPRDFAASDWATLERRRRRRCACSPAPTSSASQRPRHFDGVYTYDFDTYNGGKFARLCAQAHAMHLVCAPSVGPGYDGRRAGELAAEPRPRANGATYDRLWTCRPRGRARHRLGHELQRVGRGDADRAGAGPPRLHLATTARGASPAPPPRWRI